MKRMLETMMMLVAMALGVSAAMAEPITVTDLLGPAGHSGKAS